MTSAEDMERQGDNTLTADATAYYDVGPKIQKSCVTLDILISMFKMTFRSPVPNLRLFTRQTLHIEEANFNLAEWSTRDETRGHASSGPG